MTQEEKNLLLRDLCARLPYGVKVLGYNKYIGTIGVISKGAKFQMVYLVEFDKEMGIEYIKPYLRPMSSMTEEEAQEYWDLCYQDQDDI